MERRAARTRAVLPTTIVVLVLVLTVGVIVGAIIESRQGRSRLDVPLDADPGSTLARSIDASPVGERRVLEPLAGVATSTWLGGSPTSVRRKVADVAAGAARRRAVAIFVAYNIPGRDCGSYSASAEAVSAARYRDWITALAAGLGHHRAIVIVEPDALAQLDCLDARGRRERIALLRFAVHTLAAQGSWAYLDAGHSGWLSSAETASRLERAGVDEGAGFSLNVSNFRSTAQEIAYGTAIGEKLSSPTHFVVDTSRNGAAVPDGTWCNPQGAALGALPTTATGSALVDAYLWIKTPGFSDGDCNGGPPAGQWWPEYAMGLVRNAPDAASG